MEEKKRTSKKNYKLVLFLAGLLLFAGSVLVHITDNFIAYRGLRGIVSFLFLLIMVFYNRKETNLLLIIFLSLYGSASILTIWYESNLMAVLSLALNFVAVSCIVVALWKKASFKNLGVSLSIVFFLLLAVNTYLLYQLIAMIKDFNISNLLYAVMLLGAMTLVVAGALSLLYNHSNNTKASLVFTVFVFLLIFAEIFRAISYYDFGFGNASVYIARASLIIATALLVHFSIMPKTEGETLSH